MLVERLHKAIPQAEFDYLALLNALTAYAQPRAKIGALLKQGVIVRVKKGLYVYGEAYRRKPYAREILANLIFGPSCVSLDSALSHYGLIPERVEALTSVTPKRANSFYTPVGLFSYASVPEAGFFIGVDRIELDDGRAYLIACPEKALADKLWCDRGASFRTLKECSQYLAGLRIEGDDLRRFNVSELEQLAQAYGSRKIHILSKLLRQR